VKLIEVEVEIACKNVRAAVPGDELGEVNVVSRSVSVASKVRAEVLFITRPDRVTLD
jgi:hypothetical protein